jgi:hypothetical protein
VVDAAPELLHSKRVAELTAERRARIEHWAGEPIAAVALASRGYTPAARFLVSFASGKTAARAGLPLIPNAPRVRIVQLEQLGPALRWAARALDLPQLDG